MKIMRLTGLIGIVIILALFCVPVVPAQSSQCGPQGIVGAWLWFDGEKVIANSDRTLLVYPNGASSQPSDTGTWELSDVSKQAYTMRWAKGPLDTLTLSSDCNSVDGFNQYSTHVTGTRIGSGGTCQCGPQSEDLFGMACALGFAELGSASNYSPPSDPGFVLRALKDARQSAVNLGVFPASDFDPIISRLEAGARPSDVYQDIFNLRYKFQKMSVSLCGCKAPTQT
jgi:hypothetical protein